MVLYLIKEITGSVRWTSLRDKAGEGHAVQNLGQKVVLNEASLAKEGSLHNVRIRVTVTIPRRWECRKLIHMDIRWNEKQVLWSDPFLERDCKTSKTNHSKGFEINILSCWNSGCKIGNKSRYKWLHANEFNCLHAYSCVHVGREDKTVHLSLSRSAFPGE